MKSRKTMVNVLKAIFQCTPAAALVCVLCSLVYSLCATCSTTFLARMLETAQILSPSILPEMLLFAACYLLIQIIRKIFNLIQDISWNVGVEEMCKYRFQMELSEKIGVLPYINFEDEQIHDRIVRARNSVDSMALTQAYTNFLAVAESFITVLGLVAAMMSYNGWYLPIMALSVIPFFISRLKAGKEFYQLQWFQASHVRKRNYFYSLFTTSAFQKEQRIFGFGDYFKQRWNKERRLVEDETVAFRNTDSRHLAWCETWITAGYVCSILLSAILVAQGKICLGVFGAGIYAFRTAQDCTRCFFALYGFLNENLLEASNFFDFLNFDEEPKGDRSFSHLQQGIAVTNVKFTYPNTNTPALNIQQLRIQAGERVVIVGENGSGKSTLVKLLTGLYVPQEGQIQYDGIDLRSISREDLSKLIGAVSQEFVSYHLSIRDNMGMRNPELVEDDNRIHTALVQAGLKLSSDYDQWLGREFGGTELSGGQWQRLAIASVLGKECQVIFLDEPTSALDPNAEYEILKHFMQLSDNKTAVIISHRVGLCRLADKVVYLKQGQVEGVGSHQQLMDTCEAYRDFYFEQAKWHIA